MSAKQQENALERLILWPGDQAADLIGVEDEDSRMLLRLFVNLTIYSKIAVLALLLFM